MTRIKYTLAAALAIGLATAPARAADPTDLDKAVERLDKAARALEEARKVMTDLAQLHGRVITAEGEISILKQEVADLKKRLDVKSTTALKPDTTTSAFRGQGRVRFINDHPLPMSVVVNGLSYRLAPGAERSIPVPPGTFSYQVLQINRFPEVREIEANQIKTFTIHADE
jgi:hypothetical protein